MNNFSRFLTEHQVEFAEISYKGLPIEVRAADLLELHKLGRRDQYDHVVRLQVILGGWQLVAYHDVRKPLGHTLKGLVECFGLVLNQAYRWAAWRGGA